MSGSGNNESKKGKGRQKVEMVKIENETNLQVTFSKRRSGLFKKASELSTLCGAETAVVVFSPGNKAHCFGHPSVDIITNRFLKHDDVAPMTDADKLVEAHQRVTVNQQNLELAQIQKELEIEQKCSRELEKERMDAIRLRQLPEIDKLNLHQLQQLKGSLLRIKHQLQTKVHHEAGTSTSRGFDPNDGDHGPMIPYDLTAASESCPVIPYSSAASNER